MIILDQLDIDLIQERTDSSQIRIRNK